MMTGEAHDHIYKRLDVIDNKLDSLTDAIVRLTTVEERLLDFKEALSRLATKIDGVEKDTRETIKTFEKEMLAMQISSAANSKTISNIERAGWVVFTAAIGFAFYLFK